MTSLAGSLGQRRWGGWADGQPWIKTDQVPTYLAGGRAKAKQKQKENNRKQNTEQANLWSTQHARVVRVAVTCPSDEVSTPGCVRSHANWGRDSWLSWITILLRIPVLKYCFYQGFVIIFSEEREGKWREERRKGRRGGSIFIQIGARNYQSQWDGHCRVALPMSLSFVHLIHFLSSSKCQALLY